PMTEDEFVKSILSGLTAPPQYFPANVLMNIKGYESLDTVMEKGNQPLNPLAFEVLANETEALILDTRDADIFAQGFIPNSINIGLNGSFAQWVGEMIPGVTQEILLVTDLGKEEEAMIRLSRIGYDGTIGYLEGGFDAWKNAGKQYDQVSRITPEEFEEKYAGIQPLFDVRKKSEFDSQHILGAINVPLNQINQHLAQFPKDQLFVLTCAGGYRSMIAASILKSRGWDNFVDVVGGFAGLSATNLQKSDYVCPSTML
ncbi:MAG TPA: rhodanese-like domain-containing protein, partial [Saprospiraceae bacterium]|nr:rhodanese-like domain-containing protein [Saprospiraceae bacterium]